MVVVETMKKGSSEKKASSGAGLNGGSKSNAVTGVNGGSKESRVESASFGMGNPFALSELHMEKSITSTNGERWKEWAMKEAAKGRAMREAAKKSGAGSTAGSTGRTKNRL